MLTQDDLQQIAHLFDKKMDEKLEPIQKDILTLREEVKTVSLNVEALREANEKAHAEIMNILVESNEANGQEVKKLEKRVDRIEKHLDLPPLKH